MIDKPDPNETDAELQTPEPAPARSKGAGFALFIAFLALFFTATGIAAGYRHWQRMNDKAKANAAQIAQLQESLASKADNTSLQALDQQVKDTLASVQDSTGKDLQKIQQVSNQAQQYADSISSQVEQVTRLQARLQQSVAPTTPKEWKLEEVAFLLRLANQQLHLTGNRDAALAALREADRLLGESGSVTYLPVRQQVTRDLAALEAFIPPDVAGISQQINGLMLSLPPVLPVAPAPAVTDTPAVADQEAGSIWEQYKQKALATLNEAVVVHQLDQPLTQSMDTEARQSVFQLLMLRLENLRLLALQGQDQGYHQQIALLRETISNYYPQDQASHLLEQLDKLDGFNLKPATPDISASLTQMENARQSDHATGNKP